jgi:uncharacterized protein YceK
LLHIRDKKAAYSRPCRNGTVFRLRTIFTHTNANFATAGPYRGVRLDCLLVLSSTGSDPTLPAFPPIIPFCIIDFPLSLALDTVCLPYDIFHNESGTNPPPVTRQISDPLVWNGETVYPERGPSIWYAFPEGKKPEFDWDTKDNWKSHRANWAINDGVLFLVSVEAKIDHKRVGIDELFPGETSPISATWFSGTIIIPRGKELGLMKEEFRNVYAKEMHLTIENGKVVKTEEKTFDRKNTPVRKVK